VWTSPVGRSRKRIELVEALAGAERGRAVRSGRGPGAAGVGRRRPALAGDSAFAAFDALDALAGAFFAALAGAAALVAAGRFVGAFALALAGVGRAAGAGEPDDAPGRGGRRGPPDRPSLIARPRARPRRS